MRISKAHREALLDAFDQGTASGLAFAREHGVNYQTFASWIQKRRRERGQYPSLKTAPTQPFKLTLAEVDLPCSNAPELPSPPPSSSAHEIKIVLPCGVSLHATHSDTIPLLLEIICALRPC
ncbi:MAG: hypothetical protein QM680_04050 [Luteolibacter sp.]